MREKNASLEPFTTKKGPENALNIAVDLNLALQTLKRGLEVRRMHRVQVLSLASRFQVFFEHSEAWGFGGAPP
jgi:hypothetical protein